VRGRARTCSYILHPTVPLTHIMMIPPRRSAVQAKNTHDISAAQADYSQVAAEAQTKYMSNPDRTFTYFDIAVGEKQVRRLVFELFKSTCPKTCENFTKLCTGEAGETDVGLALAYVPLWF
jgi:hypothetical protein